MLSSWLESRFHWAQLWIIELFFATVLLACDAAYDALQRVRRYLRQSPDDVERNDKKARSEEGLIWHSYTTTVISRMPWAVLSFVLSMFVMVEALSFRGWLNWVAFALGHACAALGPYGSGTSESPVSSLTLHSVADGVFVVYSVLRAE